MAAMGLAGFGMQNNNNNNHNHYENENEKFDSREYNEIQDSVYNGPLISDNESSRYESRRSMRNELKLKESK